MADLVAFGKKLAAARDAKKLSILDVALKTSIPIDEIEALEEGRRQTPEPCWLWILADLYRLDYKQLMIECGNLIPKKEETAK